MDIALSAGVFIICAWFCARFLRRSPSPRRHALDKCVPSAACFALSLYSLFSASPYSAWRVLLCAGLFVCALGDWVLEFHFIPGAALFASAHLCFASAFVALGGFTPNILCIVLLPVVLCAVFVRFMLKSARLGSAALYLIYIAAISLMTAYAANCGALFLIGALLFVLSDSILGLRIFGRIKGKYLSYLIMISYYLALYLFALGSLYG